MKTKVKEYKFNIFDFMMIMEESFEYQSSSESIIKHIKGNIPIDRELFRKYKSTEEIFNNEFTYNDDEVKIKYNFSELKKININKSDLRQTKTLAKNVFQRHNLKNIFENDGNKIIVTGKGIEESISKIFESRKQRDLIEEHFKIFSDLGNVIQHAKLVNQASEIKYRNNINHWNYYYAKIDIDGKKYIYLFDVRSIDNGENQYRVGRLKLKTDDSTRDVSNNTKILRAFEPSISDNNIPQSPNKVKL